MSNTVSIPLFDRLRILGAFVALVRNPDNLDRVLALSDRIGETPDALERLPAPLRAVAENLGDHDPVPPVEALRRLPDGTVGREYARFLDDNGLEAGSLRPVTDTGAMGRFRAHMRGAHDLWHVATGWGPDLVGELGLQAFYLAQLRVPISGFILIAGGIHTLLHKREHAYSIFDAVAEGWRQGNEARLLAGLRWADWMDRSVTELQDHLGIVPATPRQRVAIAPLRPAEAA